MESTKLIDEAKKILTVDDAHRKYGSGFESTVRTAMVASVLTGTEISPEVVTAIYIAGKMCREGYSTKEDNIVDAIAYLQMFSDIKDKVSEVYPNGTKFLSK